MQLLVEIKREAFPRDVRETIWQRRNYLAHVPDAEREIVAFLVARAISPGARDILREAAVGLYDLGGSIGRHHQRHRQPARGDHDQVLGITRSCFRGDQGL